MDLWSVVIKLPDVETARGKLMGVDLELTSSAEQILSMFLGYYERMIKPVVADLLAGRFRFAGKSANPAARLRLAADVWAVVDMLVYRRLEAHRGEYVTVRRA
jgi:hypothetical protein